MRFEAWDRGTGKTRKAAFIDAYMGYQTPDGIVLRGRVLTASTASETREDQGRWISFRQMLRLFITREVAGVTVRVVGHDEVAITDTEGYFTLPVARDALGDVSVGVVDGNMLTVVTPCDVQLVNPAATQGVISDIDDTMMQTGAWSLWRNLWTSLTGNPLGRKIFPDAIALIETLTDAGRNPVFFVSSSPWNFHAFLNAVFTRAGLRRGPMFLRDYGFGKGQFITGAHGDHKGGAIDTILAANPGLPFVLLGDTGQQDPAVYAAAVRRHPGRIKGVVLRAPGRGADAADLAHVKAIKALGVPVFVDVTYDGVDLTPSDADLPDATQRAGRQS